jgi:hypothetical protein
MMRRQPSAVWILVVSFIIIQAVFAVFLLSKHQDLPKDTILTPSKIAKTTTIAPHTAQNLPDNSQYENSAHGMQTTIVKKEGLEKNVNASDVNSALSLETESVLSHVQNKSVINKGLAEWNAMSLPSPGGGNGHQDAEHTMRRGTTGRIANGLHIFYYAVVIPYPNS